MRKICWWLGGAVSSLSLSLLKELVGSSCFPCVATPHVLGCWDCILLSCRHLELCDLKMQCDSQSVVKGRISCRLPLNSKVHHLRFTKYYLRYSLFILHKIQISFRLPVNSKVHHLRFTKYYLRYSLFILHKIQGADFATLLLTFFICSVSPGLRSLRQRQKLFSTSLKKVHNEWTFHNRISGWIQNRILSDCSLNYFSFTEKEKLEFPCDW